MQHANLTRNLPDTEQWNSTYVPFARVDEGGLSAFNRTGDTRITGARV